MNFHWLHHLFTPHCEYCEDNKREDKICRSCETLKHQLEIANHEKKQLLESILEANKPQVEIRQPEINLKDFQNKAANWKTRQALLEKEDRERAKLLKQRNEELKISELEKELEIEKEDAS